MATYEYVCRNKECENFNFVFEKRQSINDKKLTKCKCCEKETLERLISRSNFILNGVGVHKNGTN